jgi:hypothetical protein
MQLLDIDTIKQRLDDRFLPLEPMLTGMRLSPLPQNRTECEDCATRHELEFPSDFAQLTSQFDFGNLTVGPIVFGNDSDYFAGLYDANEDSALQQCAWWQGPKRPDGIIVVAQSDPFDIFLDTRQGSVMASGGAKDNSPRMVPIARSFEQFFRGIATVMLQRDPAGDNGALAISVAEAVGANPDSDFWQWLAS